MFTCGVSLKETVLASSLALLLCLAVAELLQQTLYADKAAALLIIAAASLSVFTISAVKFCGKRFGGLTGDIFGAIGELSEILFLMVTSLWLRHSI
jgi:cobalamin synthase